MTTTIKVACSQAMFNLLNLVSESISVGIVPLKLLTWRYKESAERIMKASIRADETKAWQQLQQQETKQHWLT